jgi:hypothetical protein
MVAHDFIFSLLVALVISIIFARILTRKGPRTGFIWFYLTIFLAVLAAGLWLKPYGAPLTGSNWLPFLTAGIMMAILLFILAPRYPEVEKDAQLNHKQTMEMLETMEQEKKVAEVAYISFNLFLWFIIFLLVAAVLRKLFM